MEKLPVSNPPARLILGMDKQVLMGKFGSDVIWNIASLAVLAVCGIIVNIIIAWYYSPDVLGAFNQVYAVYMVFSQLAVAGIHLSVLKYVAQYSSKPGTYRSLFTVGLFLSSGFALVACIVFWLIRGEFGRLMMNNPGVGTGVAYATLGLFFFSINKVFLSMLNGLSRMKSYAIFQALRYIFMILALIGATILHSPGDHLGVIFSVAESLLFLCMLPVTLPEMQWPSMAMFKEWSKKHLDFGIRGFFSNVLLQLNTRVDVLILGHFYDDRIVGIYSFAAILAEGIYQLPLVLQLNYNPILVNLIADQKIDELKKTIKQGVRFSYRVMLTIGLTVVLLYPLGISLVTNKAAFMQSWPILAILMTGIVLGSGYVPFGTILLQAGRPGLHTLMIMMLVFTNIAGNYLLVPVLGATGSAIATGCSYALLMLLLKLFTKNALKLNI
ncbi:MAG TPA: oligosaccharide flippase family protein [Anaerolineaceae bacterium]|nr:oligosaccharide flippase family protein [Anaerolineaceae bacterium]